MEPTTKMPGETTDDAILRTARHRFQQSQTADAHNREAALEDIKFAYNVENGQWPEDIRNERTLAKRPCLSNNKLHKFVVQVTNRERDMRMAGRVVPVDDKGDVQTAKIYEDLIRQIEFASDADEIYTHAGEQAISGGFGYWRILTRYIEDSFDQEIVIEPIDNQFCVYLDPKGHWGFIREGMSRTDFEARYPGELATDFDYKGLGEEFELWYQEDKVFIAEYFYEEPVDKVLALAMNLRSGEVETIALTDAVTLEVLPGLGYQVLRTRTIPSHVIRWVKMTGQKVLERRTWPGREIPIIEVIGERVNISGKIYKRSLIRDGKDPQRAYNYWWTTMTETVGMMPDAPYLISDKAIDGYEAIWRQIGQTKQPYLPYNEKAKQKPSREQPPTIPTGASAMLNIADRDLNDTIGIYEPGLGQQSNERSGRAINARQMRSDIGVLHFPDNLARAIRQTVKQLIDIIPKTYDTQRVVRLRGVEGAEALVTINQALPTQDGGMVIVNDLSVGRYDLRQDVRTYSTRRQEATDFMRDVMQYAPSVAPLILDLVFKYQDLPGAEEIQARLKKYMDTLMQQGGAKTPPAGGGTPTPAMMAGQPQE